MNLISLLSSKVSAVYAAIRQYGANPVVSGVPVQTYKYSVKQNAQVSEHVLVDLTNLKKLVNDNIAPGPRQWSIEGYIGGLPIELVGREELMPSVAMMRDMLDTAYRSRGTINFVDSDQMMHDLVAIEDLQMEKTPDVQNRLLVRITLRELTILTASVSVGEFAAPATPADGTIDGPVATGSSPPVEALTSSSPALAGDSVTEPFLGRLRGGIQP